ncbi:MAG: endonuclease III [Candidatus Latescibacteria bacterium]|nr:endonuclease III [Candidatus Latescibacterota bacterium]
MSAQLKKQALAAFKGIQRAFPEPRVELDYTTPLELLVATVLAAQCTDVKVNEVTATLFKKYRRPEDYLAVPVEELEEDIHPTGFFRQKAKNIRGAMQIMVDQHQGQVPDQMEALTNLPGVGRKSANVILGNIFGVPGIVVDTHMTRVAQRLGLTQAKGAEAVERALGELLPPKNWTHFSQIAVLHGRHICKARKPLCDECTIMDICPYFKEEIAPNLKN